MQLWAPNAPKDDILRLWNSPSSWQRVFKQEGSTVYRLASFDNYIVKLYEFKREHEVFNKAAIRREYDVGLLLNALNDPQLAKTYAYIETGVESAAIVTEYIKGPTLYKLLSEPFLTPEKIWTVVSQIAFAILRLQDAIDFTHYDLHGGNIICMPLSHPETETYNINGNIYRFTCYYRPVIIDFGLTYVKGIKPTWTKQQLLRMRTPGIPNPYVDISFFVSILTMTHVVPLDNHCVTKLLELGLITRHETSIGLMNWSFVKDCPPGMTLDDMFWASNINNNVIVEDTIDDFCRFAVYESIKSGKTLEQIDTEVGVHLDEPERIKLIKRGSVSVPIDDYMRDRYMKQLGESMVHEAAIRLLPNVSPAELVYMLLGM